MKKRSAAFTFVPDEKRIQSIRAIIDFLLLRDDLDKAVRQRFLDRCLWQWTIAHGNEKYDLRYASLDALPLVEQKPPEWRKSLRHDHVYTRADLLKSLLEKSSDLESILTQAVGCIVTVEEHQRLTRCDKTHDGWNRYIQAKIKVFDRQKKTRVKLRKLMLPSSTEVEDQA